MTNQSNPTFEELVELLEWAEDVGMELDIGLEGGMYWWGHVVVDPTKIIKQPDQEVSDGDCAEIDSA